MWFGQIKLKKVFKPVPDKFLCRHQVWFRCSSSPLPPLPPLQRCPCWRWQCHIYDTVLEIWVLKLANSNQVFFFAGEEESFWWRLRLPLILCCCKSTFWRLLLIIVIQCSCSFIQCPCPCACSLIFRPRAVVFCSWAVLQHAGPDIFKSKLPLPLIPPAPAANSQLQHPGGDVGGPGQSKGFKTDNLIWWQTSAEELERNHSKPI